MILWWKVSSAPVASLMKEQGKQCPALRASLWVTEKYTSITNILNAVAHLQLKVCKSSQDLFKHLTNKNHHKYLQNHIKSISRWSLSNHQWGHAISRNGEMQRTNNEKANVEESKHLAGILWKSWIARNEADPNISRNQQGRQCLA